MSRREKSSQLSLQLGEGRGAHPEATALLRAQGIEIVTVRDAEKLASAVTELHAGQRPVGFDLETAPLARYRDDDAAGLDPLRSRIRLAQFYGGGPRCWILDLDALPASVLEAFLDLPLVAHNAAFEAAHLAAAGLDAAELGCTLLAHNALVGGYAGLAELAQERLGWKLSKELQRSDWARAELSPEQLAYAALDAVCARALAVDMSEELRASPARKVYRLMRDAVPVVARMELAGMPFDRAAHGLLVQSWERALGRAEDELRLVLGASVDPSSSSQLAAWLEHTLDAETLAAWPRTATGRLRTAASALARFPSHPAIAPLVAHREAAVRLASFGRSFAEWIHPETGRIHARYRLGATPSGRMASMKPNLQNPPRDSAFRALFRAPEGRAMVVADYSQIELRVAALLSRDPGMAAAYSRGEDLHSATAAAITGAPLSSITAHERQLAKAVNFGLLFGQGARGLAAYAHSSYGVEMSIKQAEAARRAFFAAWPGLARWQRETGHAAERREEARTPCGRRIDHGPHGRTLFYTEALNLPVQGGAAEVLMAALVRLAPLVKSERARLVNVVHDELVLEAPLAEAEDIATEVEEAMIQGMLDVFPQAPVIGLAEAGVGLSWAEAKSAVV